MVRTITIETERETRNGWVYRVVVGRGPERSEHDVTLAWVDHDHWCGGRYAPSHVVERLMEVLGDRELPARFDAATARRWIDGLDERLMGRLG